MVLLRVFSFLLIFVGLFGVFLSCIQYDYSIPYKEGMVPLCFK